MESKIDIVLSNGDKAGDTLKELTKQANLFNKEIKDLKPGTEAFIAKAKDLETVNGKITGIKEQIKGTTKASDLLKNSFSGVLGQIPGFSQISGVLSQAKGGVGGLSSGFGVLKGAIAATGIGLLVLGVSALISALSKFTPIIDKVEQVLSGISSVINELLQRVQQFSAGLFKLITGAPGGLKQLSSSFDGLSDSIGNAYDAGVQLKVLEQDLEDAARGVEIANARAGTQIEKLILMSKNKTRSDREQIDILNKAKKIAEENFKQNDAQNQKQYDALIKAAKLKSKLSEQEIIQLTEGTLAQDIEYAKRGTLDDELLIKIKDKLIERINAEGQTNKLLEKITNAEDARNEKREAAAEKAAAAARKREEERLAALRKQAEEEAAAARNIEDIKLALEEEGLQKEIDRIRIETKRKIEEVKGSDAQIMQQVLLLEDLGEKLVAEAKEKAAKAAEEKDKLDKANELARLKDLLDKKIAAIDLATSTELNALNERNIAGVLSQEDYVKATQQLVIDSETEKLNAIKESHGVESKEYQDQYGKVLNLQKAANDSFITATEELNKKLIASVTGTLGVFGGLFGSLAGLFEEGTQQYKDFATAQAIISAIQGAINAYTSAQAIPYVGEFLAPIAAASALAAGYAQVNKIQNTEVKSPVKAEQGMVLSGPSHAQGGIPLEAEGDEIILTKGVFRNPQLRSMASAINVAGGGRKFAAGGPVNPFQDRSRSPITSSSGSDNASDSSSDMKKFIGDLIAAQDRRIDRIKVTAHAYSADKTGYQDQVDTRNKIQKDSDV